LTNFAGTGSRAPSDKPHEAVGPLFGGDVYEDDETRHYRDGSAKIVIALPDPFDGYLFIGKSTA
jgi:hypothetical protein